MELGRRQQSHEALGIRKAISSGMLARLFGLLLNLLALPVTFQVLGEARFAAFIAIVGLARQFPLPDWG